MSSRHGAFDPGAGLRPVFSAMAALSLPAAMRSGGTIDAVTRLPPDVGPSGQLRIADADLDLMRIEAEFARDRVGDDRARSGADVLDRGGGDETAALDRELDLRPSCQR